MNLVLHSAQHLAAGIFTVLAGFCTDAAVLVHLGVASTLLATRLAGGRTSLDHVAQHRALWVRATTHQGGRSGSANIGTVLVEANALHQVAYHLLGEASVGANGTSGSTLVERLDHRG